MANYNLYPIAALGKVVTGKTPSTSKSEYYDGEYLFITPTELHSGYRITNSKKTLTKQGMRSIEGNTISGDSVLVGCIGWDMGNVALCNETCATNQQINSITKISSMVNPVYLYYWLSDQKEYLTSIASVTRTPILSKSTFEQVLVPLPTRDKQDHIARVLETIDRLIFSLNQINDNLLSMAHEVYMHLFFRRAPNARLGEILIEHPKSTVQVGDAKGVEGRIPFFTSGDSILRWNESMVSGRFCLLNTGGNADVKFYAGEAAYSTDTWCISAKENMTDYLYLLLHTIRRELDQKFFTGTGLKHLQKSILKDRTIYKPSVSEIKEFNELVVPALTQISENIRENNVLVGLRDWLLPILMNGQATIKQP